MAEQNFVPRINRRHLLVSAAALTATSTGKFALETAAAKIGDAVQPSATPDVPPADFGPGTVRRLLEIERRNQIRRQAQLPLLSIPAELRRIKMQEDAQAFEQEFARFEASRREAVWEQVLKQRRNEEGPDWRPGWLERMACQNRVRDILLQQFRSGPINS